MVTNAVKKKGRGRSPTHPVDRLRTKIWFNVIKLQSGLRTPHAVEMLVDGEHVRKRDADVSRTGKWVSYKDGKKVPDDKREYRNAIEQADEHFPGTANWFRSPIWPVLREEKCDKYFIDAALRQLQPEIVAILYKAEKNEFGTRLRQRPFDANCLAELAKIGEFDSLVAGVLLVALSEEISCPKLRDSAIDLIDLLQTPIEMLPEITPYYVEFATMIFWRCKRWIFLSPNKRSDLFRFPLSFIPYILELEEMK